jgi:hypothetical protein
MSFAMRQLTVLQVPHFSDDTIHVSHDCIDLHDRAGLLLGRIGKIIDHRCQIACPLTICPKAVWV